MFLAAPITTQPSDDASQTGEQVNNEKESKISINVIIGGCVGAIVIIISEYPLISAIHVIGKSVLQSERHSSTHERSVMGDKFCFFVRVS